MRALNSIVQMILVYITMGLPLFSFAQISVIPVSQDNLPDQYEGFYYSLPKTYVKIDVWVDKTEKIKGPFADYANRMLGLSSVITGNSTVYTISSIAMSTYQEVDPDQFFFVRIPAKDIPALQLSFNPDGSLQSYQQPEKANKGKRVSGTLQTQDIIQEAFSNLTLPGVVEKVDTFIRRITVDTMTFESITFPRSYIEKSLEQKAREAADFILKLEDEHLKLITGFHEVNYSAESMKFMSDNIRQLQKEYLALFKGKSKLSTSLHSFVFIPEPGTEEIAFPLFRFSPSQGIVSQTIADAETVTILFESLNKTGQIRAHETKRFSLKRKDMGLYYRIPDKAKFVLQKGNDILNESQLPVNQLGVISFLPSKGVAAMDVHEKTGTLQRLKIE